MLFCTKLSFKDEHMYIYLLSSLRVLSLDMALFLITEWNFNQTSYTGSCEVFNQQQSIKTFLTEVHKLLKLYLTFQLQHSSERNFLALKRIKVYLRNSMTHKRLIHCILILYIHQERTDALDLNSIVKEFARANERPITFFRHLIFGPY